MSPIAPELASYCNQWWIRAQSTKTRAMLAQSFAIEWIVVWLQIQGNPIAIMLEPATIQFFYPMVPTSHCQIRTQSNQSCHNPESPCYQIEMQWDLKTTKDCNVIDRIAKELHRLQADCSNGPPRRGINSNPNLFGKFQDQSCNPGPISSHLHNPWTINKIQSSNCIPY